MQTPVVLRLIQCVAHYDAKSSSRRQWWSRASAPIGRGKHSRAGYKTNVYQEFPLATNARLALEWRRCFDHLDRPAGSSTKTKGALEPETIVLLMFCRTRLLSPTSPERLKSLKSHQRVTHVNNSPF
jgi:hypothetical protein